MSLRLETARRLLVKARDDCYMLMRVVDDPSAPVWALGFHAQQAVEKSLKAVLAAHGVEYPLTHNLSLLLAKLAAQGLGGPPDSGELPQLTPFGVAFRYDDASEAEEVNLDRTWTKACMDRTLAWAEAQLAALGDS